MSKLFFIIILLGVMAQGSFAQENLETIEVSHDNEDSFSEYWEENTGTQIYSGKKNTVTDLDAIPALQTNNYRQATSQTPGLLISEIPNEALAAMTYRGLGDPHESYNVLLLQDGIPVAADMYGYPAHYFSPALPMMDKFQFIRGGAGLLYGPQPGGVVNYISEPLFKGQQTNGKVGLTYGSYNLFTSNNALYGSEGDHAYGIEYYRRQGDGPQRKNSDFSADYVQLRDYVFKGQNTYKFSFNGYNSDHGETGGFAKTSAGNANEFGDDLGKATKEHDRLKVARAQLAAGLERRIDEASQLDVTLWATAYNRYSHRQRGAGFGVPSTTNETDITTQKYYGYNGQIRYLRNYSAFGNEHTFTGGYLNYNLISPIHTERNLSAPDAISGSTRLRSERETHVNSFFAENRFTFGKLMVTPGVRLENITQSIDERKNVAVTGDLRENQDTENVPLFGLGLSYHLTDASQIYANASESYKPITYAQGLPTDPNEVVSDDLEASKVVNYELGFRGQTDKLNWDVSAFYLRYENQIGEVANGPITEIVNTGAGTHKGFDVATELKLSNMVPSLKPLGDFNFYANLSVLDARFTQGKLEDNTPQYAPKTITRVGIIYRKEDKLNVALMGVFVGEHYGDDSNSDQKEIPSYTVFDLTADWTFHKNWEAHAGINNLLDKEYYSRVRNDGVIWALDRNFYAGVTYKF